MLVLTEYSLSEENLMKNISKNILFFFGYKYIYIYPLRAHYNTSEAFPLICSLSQQFTDEKKQTNK